MIMNSKKRPPHIVDAIPTVSIYKMNKNIGFTLVCVSVRITD